MRNPMATASAVWKYVTDERRGVTRKAGRGRGERLGVQYGQRSWEALGVGGGLAEDRAGRQEPLRGPGFWLEVGTEASRQASTGPMLLSLGLTGQALVPLWGD